MFRGRRRGESREAEERSPATRSAPSLTDPAGAAALPRLDFLIVGAMKCGTTTLRRVLSEHPAVHMPARELHFFGNHRRYMAVWRDGRLDPEALHEHYGRHYAVERDERGLPLLGGKTPNYMISTLTVERIQRFHPAARLVVMLRDPVSRARSHWNHLVRQRNADRVAAHRVAPSFAEHLLRNARELDEARHPAAEVRGTNILHRGVYAPQIRRLHRFFGTEQVTVLFLDDLKADPQAFFDDVHRRLGVEARDIGDSARPVRRGTAGRPAATPAEQPAEDAFLREFYDAPIRDLEQLTGRDLSAWRSVG